MLPKHLPSVADIDGSWWIAHTKSRFEKAFVWDLLNGGINYFLPLCQRVRMSGGRKRTVLMPLFPGYVFFAGDEDARYRALMTHRLCNVIPVKNQRELRQELASIEKAVEQNASLDLYPFAAVGRRCRVSAGPFQGIEGIVASRSPKPRLMLKVSMLGQSVAMEIDLDLLEPVDEAPGGQVPSGRYA
jgi:transcription antitermination factor NusG